MRVMAQMAMVMNLDKCIGCHTCSVTCKQTWTNRPGTEYVYFNNVETKPGVGYPRRYEDQEQWKGGWTLDRKGRLQLRSGSRLRRLLSIFYNPDLPTIDDYGDPWTAPAKPKSARCASPGSRQGSRRSARKPASAGSATWAWCSTTRTRCSARRPPRTRGTCTTLSYRCSWIRTTRMCAPRRPRRASPPTGWTQPAARPSNRDAGLEPSDSELPDYLPLVLDFAALHPRGEKLLRAHRADLELLLRALRDAPSPYANIIEAVCAQFPALRRPDQALVRRFWESGPPAEEVGLEPFAPPEYLEAPR